MINKYILLIVLCLIQIIVKSQKVPIEPVTIENEKIKVGFLPEVGGRIIDFRIKGKENLLKFDESLLYESAIPKVRPRTKFKTAFNGHIIWLGPQSDWWAFQNLNKKRRRKMSPWPPDPYIIYSNYDVLDKTDTRVKMKSIHSPISGITLEKEVSIESENKIRIKVKATNTSEKEKKWDLWFNTRLDGFSRSYIPASNNGQVALSTTDDKKIIPMPSVIINGFFTFLPRDVHHKKFKNVTKAFIFPDQGFIAGFSEEQMILIRFENHPKDKIHPNHATVEIYNEVTANSNLLELEYHSPYQTLSPGDSMEAWETWEIHKYSGSKSVDAQIEFIKQIIGQ